MAGEAGLDAHPVVLGEHSGAVVLGEPAQAVAARYCG